MNPNNCGLCEFHCCPFQDGRHVSTFENMLSFMSDQMIKIPILRWHRLISVCKSLSIYRHICNECRARKNVRKLALLVYDTHPPLLVLECFCNREKGMPIKEHHAFSFHPWADIVPFIRQRRQKAMQIWEEEKEEREEENCCCFSYL